MNIDNYSKAIGILYAINELTYNADMRATANNLFSEALNVLTSAEVPQMVKVPVSELAAPVQGKAEILYHPPDKVTKGYTHKEGDLCLNPQPKPEPVAELPDKTACNSKWRIGEDSFIRCSASGKEATKNKPLDCTKTTTQVLNRWHYMQQKGMLLSKNSKVIYAGGNIELSGKFKGVVGKVSAFTDDKTKAIVYFGTDASAYEIPICDLMKAGEA